MKIEDVLDVIAEVYSGDHILEINMNGICGINSMSGDVEVTFGSLEEFYTWIKLARKRL